MERIKTKEEIERKKKRNQWIVGLILTLILVLSTAGFALFRGNNQTNRRVEYNGLKFTLVNGLWAAEINGKIFYFQNLPQEVANVSVSGFYDLQTYSGKPLYFVNNNLASGEVLNNLGSYILRYQDACIAGLNCSGDLPVKTCKDNLIIFVTSDSETKVWKNENCVYISGNFIKGVDAWLYKMLGVS